MKQGTGRFIYPNGDIYKGAFLKDQKNGAGTILYNDGTFYKGLFANDVYKGKGVLKMNPVANSTIIEAIFDNGILTAGPAKIQYSNSEIFEGRINV